MGKKAFTIVELLIVVGIISILISSVIAITSGQRDNARDKKRLAETDSIRKALELFYTTNKRYPVEEDWCCIGAGSGESEECDNFAAEMIPYFSSMPRDPIFPAEYEPGKRYCYHYISTTSGQLYKVHVRLENGDDYQVYSKGGKDIPLP